MDNIKNKPTLHPADETRIDKVMHGWLPVVVAIVVLVVSVLMDLTMTQEPRHWTQRAGSIVTVLGAYVAFRDAKKSTQCIGDAIYINRDLPYGLISVAMVVVGTLVWGYADLLL
jgi:ABC-type nickel/cobalt efflux system permease component RcnA